MKIIHNRVRSNGSPSSRIHAEGISPLNSTPRNAPKSLLSDLELTLSLKNQDLDRQQHSKEKACFRAELHKRWTKLVESELKLHKKHKVGQHNAAILIQKTVRGHLIRLKYWPSLLSIMKGTSSQDVEGLVYQTNHCSSTLGSAVKPNVLVIESHYVRYRIKKKIATWKYIYNQYMLTLKEKRLNMLKSLISSYGCRIRVKSMKFEIYKQKRLVQIKERLAVLVVKKVWRKNKLSFRVVKERLVKIKRRKAALANKKIEKKPTKSLPTQSLRNTPEPVQDTDSSLSSDDSILRIELSEQEYRAYRAKRRVEKKKKQERITKAKVAHGIQELIQLDHTPLMQERALIDDPSHLLTITNSVMAKTTLCWNYPSPTVRNTMIFEGKPATTRVLPPLLNIDFAETPVRPRIKTQGKEVSDAHFMMKTTAFNRKFKAYKTRNKKHFLRWEFKNEKVLEDTIATASKQNVKKKFSKVKPWRPSVSIGHTYTPSIDNMRYTPKRFVRTSCGNRPNKKEPSNRINSPHVPAPRLISERRLY